jgi:hypothetical protein
LTIERSGFFDVTFAPFAVPEKPQLSTGAAATLINNCATTGRAGGPNEISRAAGTAESFYLRA